MRNPKEARRLCEFLERSGAEILPITNPFEISRFRTANGVCVIYQKNNGSWSYSNAHAKEAATAFLDDKPWIADKKHDRIMRKTIEDTLIERDGNYCFYCDVEFAEDTKPTLEHFLAIAHGGNNHLANLALCCEACNAEAGSLSIVDKIRLVKIRRSPK